MGLMGLQQLETYYMQDALSLIVFLLHVIPDPRAFDLDLKIIDFF